MTHWFQIDPRDPLMIRDGRPFSTDTDGARSVDFPPPSVLAGALRTCVGSLGGWDWSKATTRARALQIGVCGPLLALSERDGRPLRLLLPAPADCVTFASAADAASGGFRRFRLRPNSFAPSTLSSLPGELLPVQPITALPKAKPAQGPAYWSEVQYRSWLTAPNPAGEDGMAERDGRPHLLHERRTHVGIDASAGTAKEGMLFQTDGLRFARRPDRGGSVERMVLLAGVVGADAPKPGLIPLGGERRLSSIEPVAFRLADALPAPSEVGELARVVLLTPALFAEGSVPRSIGGAPVVAAAVSRPLTVSGWDMAARGPKPTRRMAPSGSVYWVRLNPLDRRQWMERVHLQGVCTEAQDNRDGFGLAAVGGW